MLINKDKILHDLKQYIVEIEIESANNHYNRNKKEFYLYKETILVAIQKGFSKRTIHTFLKKEGYITMSQRYFYKLCKKYIAPPPPAIEEPVIEEQIMYYI